MPTDNVISNCLVCDKPLGQESKDQDWRVCHEHRSCVTCGARLNRIDIHNAHSSAQDDLLLDENEGKSIAVLILPYLAHSRCQLATASRKNGEQDPSVLVKQSYIDWLNNYRLLCEPHEELSPETNERQADIACEPLLAKMTLEQKFLFLARMESAVAHVSIAIKSDRKLIKEKLDVREAKKFKEATKQATTSGRPNGKAIDDEKEILIGEFMKQNDLKERSVALKLWSERNKSIQGLVKAGFTLTNATNAVDSMLRSQGRIK